MFLVQLITINRIQNKSFFLHNICMCTVYIYYRYINTHTCMYISEKNFFYILNIFIYNINYMNINIDVNTCKYFQIYTVCVYLYIHNTYTEHTHIYYAKKTF